MLNPEGAFMAKTAVDQWDQNPDSNTEINGVNIAEQCPPSGINNAIREIMAQVKTKFLSLPSLIAATASELWAGTATNRYVSPKALYDAAAGMTVLADGATITPDLATGLQFTVTLGGNRTLALPTNAPKSGTPFSIWIVQGTGGSKTLTYATGTKFALNTAPVLSTAAGTTDILYGTYISPTRVVYTGFAKGIPA
jgi:hypothetical protein